MGRGGIFIRLLGIGAICALALASRAPEIKVPEPRQRTYTVSGLGLTILPYADFSYLRFEKGVTIKGEDFVLTAGKLELEIDSSQLSAIDELSLPKQSLDTEKMARDPGAAARELSRELKLPETTFNRSAIKRLAASGGVKVVTEGLTLTTPEMLSTDGGQSWSTNGRSQLAGKSSGVGSYGMAADVLVYDTVKQRAAASGSITAHFSRSGQPDINVKANKLELDLPSQLLTVSGGLSAQYGTMSLVSQSLSADLKKNVLHASSGKEPGSGPRLLDSKLGMTLNAGSIDVDLDTQQISASGGIDMEDSTRGIQLNADKIKGNLKTRAFSASGGVSIADAGHDVVLCATQVDADIEGQHYVATGGPPTVRQGGSLLSGEKITLKLEKVPGQKEPKLRVEIEGEQSVRIDTDKLPKLKAPAK